MQIYTHDELENLSLEAEEFLSNFNIYVDVIAVFNGPVLAHFEIMLTNINIPQNSISSVLIIETMTQLDNYLLELKLENVKNNRFLRFDFNQIFYSTHKNLVYYCWNQVKENNSE
jgi:hypothetical protein